MAEFLFCKTYGWFQATNSEKGYDALGDNNLKYQINGRRIHGRNKSRQLSAIRDIEDRPFDVLAALLFDDNYKVLLAALIPIDLVQSKSVYKKHTNSNLFHFRDNVMNEIGVENVTSKIAMTLSRIYNRHCKNQSLILSPIIF